MRHTLPALLVVALAACAEVASEGDGGPRPPTTEDALVGGGPLPGRPRPDGALPRGDAAVEPPGDCAGGPAPLCAECGLDGLPRLVGDDPRCPALDCSVLDTFVRTRDRGVEICIRNRYSAVGGRCLAVGRCREAVDAEWCAGRQAEEAARADRPCATLQGCVDGTPPSFAPAPEGTPCDGGRCDADGVCLPVVDDPRCAPFAEHTLCEVGVHTNGTPYCAVAVPEAGVSCADLCAAGGSVCLAAATLDASPCAVGEQRGCFDAAPSLLCRCAVQR